MCTCWLRPCIAESRIQLTQALRTVCVLLLTTGIAKPKSTGIPERITFCRDGTLHACFSSSPLMHALNSPFMADLR
jgi:hypothetical protein